MKNKNAHRNINAFLFRIKKWFAIKDAVAPFKRSQNKTKQNKKKEKKSTHTTHIRNVMNILDGT